MAELYVQGNTLTFQGRTYTCAIGKGGFSADKKEGDGATPIGIFPLRECWYRADRLEKPVTKLPLKVIQENDGWCDDPSNIEYNKYIQLPFTASYEKLFRDDGVYDFIIPMGYNDAPVVSGKGSAIFIHIAKPDYTPTEGCVALSLPDMLEILPHLSTQTRIEIKQA